MTHDTWHLTHGGGKPLYHARESSLVWYDQQKSEVIQVEEISHLDNQDRAEKIADNQARISNTYKLQYETGSLGLRNKLSHTYPKNILSLQ